MSCSEVVVDAANDAVLVAEMGPQSTGGAIVALAQAAVAVTAARLRRSQALEVPPDHGRVASRAQLGGWHAQRRSLDQTLEQVV